LREAYEEIGLPPQSVRLICTMKPAVARFLIMIHPVIALEVAPFEPFCSDEVEKIYYAPLSRFLKAENYSSSYYLESYQLHFFDFEELPTQCYGITALICIVLSMILENKYPEFKMDVIVDLMHKMPPRKSCELLMNFFAAGDINLLRQNERSVLDREAESMAKPPETSGDCDVQREKPISKI